MTELRLADITTLADANRFLVPFLTRYNQQFGVPARESGRAYRALESDRDVEQICCFVYYRTVGTDNTVRLGTHRIQLQPGPGRMSYAKTRVEVQERLDGALAVYFQGQCLATQVAPEEAAVLRARAMGRPTPLQSETVSPAVAVEGVGFRGPEQSSGGPLRIGGPHRRLGYHRRSGPSTYPCPTCPSPRPSLPT